ncbi:unnamed protein product [Didymodactylos carnosus]|uniref:Signal peptide peptidase-like 3 n=1 Tax=Didymodactylos carnosus TaxID=1234261 RepID=A0A8S2D772_9BILA|nr:unnamed protein product [Didymodactylos carnosus]CAF3611608.1 unnamed protein product [Didymodactylos carnosus]
MLIDVIATISTLADSEEKQTIVAQQVYWTTSVLAVVDSSHISTFIVALILIIYGSFRSLEQERLKDINSNDKCGLLNSSSSSNGLQLSTIDSSSQPHVIDTIHAIILPLGASASLLIMFFFFESIQTIFVVCTAVLATMGFAFLLSPFCRYLLRSCSDNSKISCGVCGRYTSAEIVSFFLGILLVGLWILTGHWLLMDAIAMGLCVSFIALVRLPSLKVSILLLVGLVIYDVFWVYFSQYLFNANVMVRVATKEAENPLATLAKKLHLNRISTPKLSLPGKLVFPSSIQQRGRFSMLGLGDIVKIVKEILKHVILSDLLLYLGLLTATLSSEVFKCAQPALLFLVPFTLLPLLIVGYFRGDLCRMWSEPFTNNITAKYLNA